MHRVEVHMRRLKRVQIVTPSVLLLLIFGFLQSESAPLLAPGPGLGATIVAARVSDAGIVSVRFTLTDAAGIPLTPTASAVSSTSDPRLARVRFTIARLEVDRQSAGGRTVDFTRYMNYLLNASGEPIFDTGGSFLLEDPAGGTYRYTFGRALAAPFPASAALVHTIGGQVDRFFDGVRLAANPIFDFVPDVRPTSGAGLGGGSHVRVLNSALGLPLPGTLGSFLAYDPAFLGGVRVAVCDLSGDGVVDVVSGPGPGGGPNVRVFDGVTGDVLPAPMGSFMASDVPFVGGIFVACGDVTGDGTPDVIAAADTGAGPFVRVFDGKTRAEVATLLAFDPAFTGGVRIAACDVNNDGRADIVAAAGPGGEPRVKVFSGQNPAQVLSSFLAYDSAFTGGVFVACGSLRGSTEARIITGAGPGSAPLVRGFTGLGTAVGELLAYDPAFTGGVQVATCDLTGDGILDVVTGAGPGGAPLVRAFDGTTGLQIGSLVPYDPAFTGGAFVACNPGKGALTLQRETVATAACNGCHNPLAVHGGGRREARLCVLCHTQQLVDTETGNHLDFKVMIHKIHRGKELPSVAAGPVGTRYAVGNAVFSEKVQVCALGPKEGAPCTGDADCETGTCTGTAAAGIGFPQDLRNCAKCHTGGATAHTFKTLPSTPACVACHDNVNPSTATIVTPLQSNLGTLAAGANHDGGAQPEAACAGCHTPGGGTAADEAGISVTGAHTIPQRSQQLPGLVAELLGASGTAGNGITIRFRLKNGDGTPIISLAAPVGQISVRASGPTTDFGGSSRPMLSQNVSGAIGPDADNAFTFTTTGANRLPIDAAGTWRVGLEARRALTINLIGGPTTVTEFAQNPVLDFSVDGSPVARRRTVVAIDNCQECHGTFSKDFSVHGGSRNQTNHCVICHNPNVSDFARRANAFTFGANPALENQPINLKHLLHKVHTGEQLQNKPYIVYGFGSAPKNYTAFDFSEIRFPGDRRDCVTCHIAGSQLLPLAAGLLPTRLSELTPGSPPTETPTGSILPITDACLTCHDSPVAATHAQINTLGVVETCEVCHGEGSIAAVSAVHKR
jgi:OmcA/MtrC family decaheme c-type cytochrome